jgi:hypothetical protein
VTGRKEFDCPRCGGTSYLNPDTLEVEHSEPKCSDWLAMEARPPEPPGAAVIDFAKARADRAPELVEFTCPGCQRPCRMYPRATPIGVQHAIPACEEWQKIEGKKDDVERFLIKAGVHIYVPDPA